MRQVSQPLGRITPMLLALAALSIATAPASAAPDDFVRLSDERTRTHSSDVLRPVWVRESSGGEGRRLARLQTRTYHGSPEVVIVLGTQTVAGRTWAYIRYSGRGSRRGWVPFASLSSTTVHSTRLVLDRSRLRLRLYRGSRLLFSAPVGIGATRTPTPAGQHYIRERLGPFRNSNSSYGALAFGLSVLSPYRTDWPGGGQVGIHGTNRPSLIPGRISNGCVRLTNSKVRRLGQLIRVGTPLIVK